jgi:hypothetical protein
VTPGEYFDKATETIRSNKKKYQEAEARARLKAPSAASSLAAAIGAHRMFPAGGDDDEFPS